VTTFLVPHLVVCIVVFEAVLEAVIDFFTAPFFADCCIPFLPSLIRIFFSSSYLTPPVLSLSSIWLPPSTSWLIAVFFVTIIVIHPFHFWFLFPAKN
jgi:hypothetical protein